MKKIFLISIIISFLSIATSAYSIVFEITQFTNNDTDDLGPCVYNGTIAWTGDSDGYEIFYWDGTAINQITNNAVDDLNPKINNNPANPRDIVSRFNEYPNKGNNILAMYVTRINP